MKCKNVLWKTSWLSLLSCVHAVLARKYDLALTTGTVFLTSINYWRNPDYSWRLGLDLNTVRIAVSYHAIKARGRKDVYVLGCTGIGCYAASQRVFPTTLHALLHVFGAAANYQLIK